MKFWQASPIAHAHLPYLSLFLDWFVALLQDEMVSPLRAGPGFKGRRVDNATAGLERLKYAKFSPN